MILKTEAWDLKPFLDALAAKQPTPGGGSASALGGAIGVALGSMAANYTVGSEKYKDLDAGARAVLAKLEALREQFMTLMAADISAYENYRAAVAMPKESPAEKAVRKQTMAVTLQHSTQVPELILNAAEESLDAVLALSAMSNPNLAGDVASAAYFLEACARAASIQVLSNCAASDLSRCKEASDRVQRCQELREKIHAAVVAMIAPKPQA